MFNQNSVVATSPVHFERSGRDFARAEGAEFRLNRDYAMDEAQDVMKLAGIGFGVGVLDRMIDYAMDTIQQPLLSANVTTPIQFLQNWLPGIVEIVTAARKADEIFGRSTIGSWEDAQIVQQVLEMTGAATPYTDIGNVPLANWNQTFVTRTVVRFELGLRVGNLEEAQAARVRVDSAGSKRKSDAIQLEIQRNAVAFYGYNSGNGLTYGALNDPNLPAYVNAVTGNWNTATFLQIQGDILTTLQNLRTQSQDLIDPGATPITLAISTNRRDFLSKTSDFGISVYDWLKSTYPNVRVVSAPQLNTANGGANVYYCFADAVADSGTDDQRTFTQIVPATFQLLGVQKLAKGYEEDYSNATAGMLCKRPYAVIRTTGI